MVTLHISGITLHPALDLRNGTRGTLFRYIFSAPRHFHNIRSLLYVIALKFRPFPPRNKIDMLDNLLEIEVAYNLLQTDEGGDKEKDAFDVHYDKLKTDIKVNFTLDTGCPVWSETLVGMTLILFVPLPSQFYFGRPEFGRISWAPKQHQI